MTPDAKVYLETVDWLVMNQDNTTHETKTQTHIDGTAAQQAILDRAWFRMAARLWLTRARTMG